MSVPDWVCLDCKTKFKPVDNDGEFNFNCPACGSSKTVSIRNHEQITEPTTENPSK